MGTACSTPLSSESWARPDHRCDTKTPSPAETDRLVTNREHKQPNMRQAKADQAEIGIADDENTETTQLNTELVADSTQTQRQSSIAAGGNE